MGRVDRETARQRTADERDLIAADRDRIADERERLADLREADADQREQQWANLAVRLQSEALAAARMTEARRRVTELAATRARELVEATRQRVARAEASKARAAAQTARDLASVERAIATVEARVDGGEEEDRGLLVELQARAHELRGGATARVTDQGSSAQEVPRLRASAQTRMLQRRCREQWRQSTESRRRLAAAALVVADVEDALAEALEAAVTSRPDRAQRRRRLARRARDYAQLERQRAAEYAVD